MDHMNLTRFERMTLWTGTAGEVFIDMKGIKLVFQYSN